ncbi:hypothetical protein RIVM261_055630 [Rivularia sp. IAM M-261]|nr:hypothetical protein CAL7716_009390 [Calothrix sp. PCC 7716]GJD20607.1 hypothetical protein RIVM261_055630 [Rivularia sp. IAM M-261]
MIISDIDYLDSISETCSMHVNGGSALAISGFSTQAYGSSTSVVTFLKNLAVSNPRYSKARSSVMAAATASGGDTSIAVSASSASFVSSD